VGITDLDRDWETSEAVERDRLGKLQLLKPLLLPELNLRLKEKQLIIVAPYLTGQRAILTRLLEDRTVHKLINGTQLLESYLKSEHYLSGFPQFNQFFLQFSYSEAPNRRLADLVNEIVGLRFHLDMHCWLIVPRSIPELASQWGESLLNLVYLPILNLPPQENDIIGPNSSARTDHSSDRDWETD